MGFTSKVKSMVKSISAGGVGSDDSTQVIIPSGTFRSVPSGGQQVVFGQFEVAGSMEVAGALHVVANLS